MFGTDGIRGVALEPPLDPDTVYRIGKALAETAAGSRPRVLIGRDTRESGPIIVDAIAQGVSAGNGQPFDLGVAPTPAVAFLVRDAGFDAGIMVSASHNPYHDNGIKVFGCDGDKISAENERAIERLVSESSETCGTRSTANPTDSALINRYVEHLVASLGDVALSPFKIALDLAHGAGHLIGPRLLERLGLAVSPLGIAPDGRNINAGVGSTYPDAMRKAVVESNADFGAALDGDGDRVLMVDSQGRLIDGDAILLLCARRLQAEGRLGRAGVVATVMSNLALEQGLSRRKLQLRRTPVGDRHVAETMAAEGYRLGGEQSGHIIFADFAGTGDGLLTLIQVMRALTLENGSLDELGFLEPSPQCLVNVRVRERPPVETVPKIHRAIQRIEQELNGQGRLLVRYSGTEPLLRIMLEGNDRTRIKRWADEIAAVTRETIGVRE